MNDWHQEILKRLASLKLAPAREAEIIEELSQHVEDRYQELVAGGAKEGEAHRLVLEELSDEDLLARGLRRVEREGPREPMVFGGSDGYNYLASLWQDIRYGLRQLRRTPGFTVVAVLTLALGIGSTTAIFSVVNGILLKPLPYPHQERLIKVALDFPGINQSNWPLSPADYFIYRDQNRTFEDLGLYADDSVNVTGVIEPEHVPILNLTDGVLPILGVTPILGRSFTRADDAPGSAKTVMLSFGYWKKEFSGDRSVIGRAINVDGDLRQIIGVLPEDFHFGGDDPALLIPLQFDPAKTFIGTYIFPSVARLKPGVTLEQASADVARMLPIVLRSFSAPPGYSLKTFEDGRMAPNLRPLKQDVVGDVGKVLWVAMGGIGLVLLIACANVANLLLVRADGRQQELAIRLALGASRSRVAAGLLVESFLLALLGSTLGLALAYGALRILVVIAPADLPRLNEIGIDGTAVLFTLALSLVTSLLFGSIPALKYTGRRIGTGPREGGRAMSASRERHWSRGVLVVAQVTLALVLLVSSGLMIRTFRALTQVDPGFVVPSEVQTFRVNVPDTRVKDPERVVHIEEEILHKIEAIPGVSSVGFSFSVPMDGGPSSDLLFAKDRPDSPTEVLPFRYIAPGLIKTLGTPLVCGRDFTWTDIYNKIPVAIVSERLAREFWHAPSNALGKQIRTSPKDDWREVIGVAGDVHDDGMDKDAPNSVYWPIFGAHFESHDTYVIHQVAFSMRSSRAGSASLMKDVQKAVWSVDSDLPLADVHTLEYYYSKSMARTSFTLVMLAIAGSMALLVAIVGLYGVIAYSVSQRTHEIGIRVALGAQAGDVVKMVVRGGFKLAALGIGIGIVAALGSTRYLASLLYGVKPTDPLTFVTASVLLISVAVLASYIPAREAANVDPMVALRYE